MRKIILSVFVLSVFFVGYYALSSKDKVNVVEGIKDKNITISQKKLTKIQTKKSISNNKKVIANDSVIFDWNEFIKNNKDPKRLFEYFESLDTSEIYELMQHFCKMENIAIIENYLIPHLKSRLADGLPYDSLIKLSKNNKNNKLFRLIVLDMMSSSSWESSIDDRDKIVENLISVSFDKTEGENFKSTWMKKIGIILSKGVTRTNHYNDMIMDKIKITPKSSQVYGSLITTLRRMEVLEIIPILEDNCMDYSTKDTENNTIRHSIVALAKYSKKYDTDVPSEEIRHILTKTDNTEVYTTTLYALSLLNNKKEDTFYNLFPTIMKTFKNFSDPHTKLTMKNLLLKYKNDITKALNSNDENYIDAAINASSLVQVSENIDILIRLKEQFPNRKSMIDKVLKSIK